MRLKTALSSLEDRIKNRTQRDNTGVRFRCMGGATLCDGASCAVWRGRMPRHISCKSADFGAARLRARYGVLGLTKRSEPLVERFVADFLLITNLLGFLNICPLLAHRCDSHTVFNNTGSRSHRWASKVFFFRLIDRKSVYLDVIIGAFWGFFIKIIEIMLFSLKLFGE